MNELLLQYGPHAEAVCNALSTGTFPPQESVYRLATLIRYARTYLSTGACKKEYLFVERIVDVGDKLYGTLEKIASDLNALEHGKKGTLAHGFSIALHDAYERHRRENAS